MDIFDTITVSHIVRLYTCAADRMRGRHITSREAWGLIICKEGSTHYTIDGQRYTLEPGGALLLPKGGTYNWISAHGRFPAIDFHCENLNVNTIIPFSVTDQEACLQDFQRLQNLALFPGTRLEQLSVFYQLLSRLSPELTSRHGILAPALEYLNAHLMDPTLNNTALAKAAGISEIYLRKLFLAQLGTTPHQYILNARIRKARQLLTDTHQPISTTAEQCGFNSLYHFSRIFRQKTGMTPTQYAQENRIGQL